MPGAMRAILRSCSRRREAGEFAGGEIVQAGGRQVQAGGVDPRVDQGVVDEGAGFVDRNGFDEQQRIAIVMDRLLPALEISGTGIIAGQHADQIVVDAVLVRQIGDVALADFEVR